MMDGGKCIFMLRGVRPFLSDKYDLTEHPNYKYTADADKKYLFDMERYMKRKPAIVKPDEPFEMYELTAADADVSGGINTKVMEQRYQVDVLGAYTCIQQVLGEEFSQK